MGKDIVLPWSCDTHDIIKQILLKLVLVTAPGTLAFMIVELFNTEIIPIKFVAPFVVPLTIYGLLGTMTSWMYQICEWDLNGDLPSFRCRCDFDNTSQKEST